VIDMMDKVIPTAAEAVADVPDGVTIAVGGFGLVGVPEILIDALLEQGATSLETVSNNCGTDGFGLGVLLEKGRIRLRYDGNGGIAVASPPKETRDFDGVTYVMERGIVADYALVHAWKGDRHGNLVYRASTQNFNPAAATSGRITIAQVEHLVEPGELDPAEIHTPGIHVQRVVHVGPVTVGIENRTVRA
jgi:acyl CoA:acetate/3-ketoacid CoA transferase alpha subunit